MFKPDEFPGPHTKHLFASLLRLFTNSPLPLLIRNTSGYYSHVESRSILDIRKSLESHQGFQHKRDPVTREAAVAIVLRDTFNSIEILFIKRAKKTGDPWSGDMAFPGGHKEISDRSLAHTAMRETFEETGLQLDHEELIGSLSEQQAIPRRHRTTLLIAPYVFSIKKDFNFVPNNEVDEVVWVPLESMLNGSIYTKEKRSVGTGESSFDGYRASSEHFIWGLTYRTLQTLFSVIKPGYTSPNN